MGQTFSCEATPRNPVSRYKPKAVLPHNPRLRVTPPAYSPLSNNGEMASPADSSSDSSVVEISYQDMIKEPSPVVDLAQTACKDYVLLVIPDICPTYLEEIAAAHQYEPNATITAILDQQEEGKPYPTQPRNNPLKRKRSEEDDEEDDDDGDDQNNAPEAVLRKIRADVGVFHADSHGYMNMATTLISQDFPNARLDTIKAYIRRHDNSLYAAYVDMDTALRNWNNEAPPWIEKKRPTRKQDMYSPESLDAIDLSQQRPEIRAAYVEFRAAREFRAVKDAEVAAEEEERKNFTRAQEEGQTAECGICYDEYALNRMITCEGETAHMFCRSCMKSQAESQVGMSKYELTCMSVDGCSAGFSHSQRALFLDKKLSTALDRIEQEAMLRMAGIENLETCPFCPYAAEYPPVDVDKEFRCDNPKCEKVSCRLCRRETHIPKTCAEASADDGVDARHILEEAMSAALIRRCNTCQNPFVKQDGCNKVTCTKCRTIMCDVCRQTVKDYSHFDDSRRGGKQGQCPLFDRSEARYDEEVRDAEEKARRKVVEDNPQVNSETLKFNLSEQIRQEEQKRRDENKQQARPGPPRNPEIWPPANEARPFQVRPNPGFEPVNMPFRGPNHHINLQPVQHRRGDELGALLRWGGNNAQGMIEDYQQLQQRLLAQAAFNNPPQAPGAGALAVAPAIAPMALPVPLPNMRGLMAEQQQLKQQQHYHHHHRQQNGQGLNAAGKINVPIRHDGVYPGQGGQLFYGQQNQHRG